MKKRDHFSNALYSLEKLRENLILYLPDLLFYITTVFLSFLFLYLNDLTSIFGGHFGAFSEKLKDVLLTSSNKLVISFVGLGLFNLLFGLTTIVTRFLMIKDVIKRRKVKLLQPAKEYYGYIPPLLGVKFFLFLIYSIPIFILLGVGLLYKPLLLVMIIVSVVLLVVFKFIFLFSYPILFLGELKNPIKVIDGAVDYFIKNKMHVITIGFIIILVSLIMKFIVGFIPVILGGLSIFQVSIVASIIYITIKALIDISVGLWSSIFIFKNY